jgi:hypothetical protein
VTDAEIERVAEALWPWVKNYGREDVARLAARDAARAAITAFEAKPVGSTLNAFEGAALFPLKDLWCGLLDCNKREIMGPEYRRLLVSKGLDAIVFTLPANWPTVFGWGVWESERGHDMLMFGLLARAGRPHDTIRIDLSKTTVGR